MKNQALEERKNQRLQEKENFRKLKEHVNPRVFLLSYYI
jgi:hypothetical protein